MKYASLATSYGRDPFYWLEPLSPTIMCREGANISFLYSRLDGPWEFFTCRNRAHRQINFLHGGISLNEVSWRWSPRPNTLLRPFFYSTVQITGLPYDISEVIQFIIGELCIFS